MELWVRLTQRAQVSDASTLHDDTLNLRDGLVNGVYRTFAGRTDSVGRRITADESREQSGDHGNHNETFDPFEPSRGVVWQMLSLGMTVGGGSVLLRKGGHFYATDVRMGNDEADDEET